MRRLVNHDLDKAASENAHLSSSVSKRVYTFTSDRCQQAEDALVRAFETLNINQANSDKQSSEIEYRQLQCWNCLRIHSTEAHISGRQS